MACLDPNPDSDPDPPTHMNPDPDPRHSFEACYLSIFLKVTYPWLYQAYPSLSANKIPSMATSTHILWLGALTPLHDVLYMYTVPVPYHVEKQNTPLCELCTCCCHIV